jgi:hypothetical protein
MCHRWSIHRALSARLFRLRLDGMLVKFGHAEREAQCCRCYRRSPVLRGDEDEALGSLQELGWGVELGGAWRCPVCRNRSSGQFRITMK